MKKILILALVMLFVAGTAFAVVKDSRHDMSAAAYYSGATASACQYCHTPHLRDNPVVTGAPLWNRSLPLAASYSLYGGGQTLNGTTINNPGANSLTCLSCHDGTIGLGDILVGLDDTIATIVAAPIAGGKLIGGYDPVTGRYPLIGTDLTQEHPVGFVVIPGAAGTDTIANMKLDGARFYNGDTEMQCGTCHDPHETVAGKQPFLRMTRLTMCTDCHINK